jgi:hypothetical protein
LILERKLIIKVLFCKHTFRGKEGGDKLPFILHDHVTIYTRDLITRREKARLGEFYQIFESIVHLNCEEVL